MRSRYLALSVFLGLLFIQAGGYYLLYWAQAIDIKRQARQFVNEMQNNSDGNTVELTFALNNGKITADGLVFNDEDEFTYQGRMYDVIECKKDKGTVTFKCYTDTKETELNQNLCEKVNSDSDAPVQRQKQTHLFRILAQEYTAHKPSPAIITPAKYMAIFLFSNTQYLPSIFRVVISPPPEQHIA